MRGLGFMNNGGVINLFNGLVTQCLIIRDPELNVLATSLWYFGPDDIQQRQVHVTEPGPLFTFIIILDHLDHPVKDLLLLFGWVS